MKKILKTQFLIVAIITMLFVNIGVVDAASTAKVSVSGSSTMTVGGTATEKIIIGSISGSTVNAVSGTVSVADSSCVTINSMTGLNGTSTAGSDFILASFSGISSNTDMLSLSVKAGTSACKTTITISDIAIGFMNGDTLEPSNVTYEITVGNAVSKSSDANLKSLVPSVGTLSPAFSAGTTSYSINVPAGTNSVSFTANANDSKATVSGTTCSLTSDTTTCKVTVTAEDGTKKVYSVTVNREASTPDPGPDVKPEPTDPDVEPEPVPVAAESRLKSLDLDGFTLIPSFNPDITTYKISVANTVTGLDVTAIPMDSNAKVSISGNKYWSEGLNKVTIVVTATDGSQKTYIVNVTRNANSDSGKKVEQPKSSDNFLKELSTTNGDLNPVFDKNISNYSIVVGNEVTSLDLRAISNDSKAKVVIKGNENFKVGAGNTVTIEITAEDGTSRIYTINVTRLDKESKTKLEDIVIDGYPISPKFDPDTFTYTIDVDGDIDKLDIKAIAKDENSVVEIIGNEDLKFGNNVILVKVTDENGLVQYYRLNVDKKSAKKFLGLTLKQWLIIIGMLILLGIIFLLLFLLKRKKKEDKEEKEKVETPVIQFNPEFNFGSKNGTDDDYVESGGVLNQYSGVPAPEKEEPKLIGEATVKDVEHEEIPFDMYDEKVTKEELLAAIEEAKRTKDSSKLKMLYKQEMLNREKEALKRKEEENK